MCWHKRHEPVILSTGEEVARVCVDCLAALPARWGGDVEIVEAMDGTVVRVVPV